MKNLLSLFSFLLLHTSFLISTSFAQPANFTISASASPDSGCSPLPIQFNAAINPFYTTQTLVDSWIINFDQDYLFDRSTSFPLICGQEYRLRVSGSYSVWWFPPPTPCADHVDAAFVYHPSAPIAKYPNLVSSPYSNRPIVDVYNPAHVYEYCIIGRGAPLQCYFSDVTIPANNCGQLTYELFAMPTNLNLLWTFAGQGTSTILNPTHTFNGAGTYPVTLTVTNQTCPTDTFVCTYDTTINIIVDSSVILTVSPNTSICASGSTSLTAGGANTYTWSPGTGLSATTGTTVTANPGVTTTYTVIGTGGCGSDTDSVTVTVYTPPAVTITPPNPYVCSGQSVTLTAGGGGTYSWSTGATSSSIIIAPSVNTTYTVTAANSNGCTATAMETVTINSFPTVTLSSQTNISCNGGSNGSAAVSASGGNPPYTYIWSNGQTGAVSTNLIAGNYTVTVTAGGCAATQTATLTQPAALTATTTSTPTGCSINTGTATVNASGGTTGYNYYWNTTPAQTTSTATNLSAGNYNVTITDANGCTQTATAVVTSTGGPTATVTATITTLTPGNSTTLIAAGGGTYSWYPSTGLSCTACSNPTATASPLWGAGGLVYCVTVTDANGCTDTACVTITTEQLPCGAIYVPNAFAPPNAFSPNNDKENEKLCVYGNCIEKIKLVIYNRWGEKVFETTDISRCWDGTYGSAGLTTGGGKPLNTAVFVYYMEATLTNGEKITKKGNVSLVR